MIDRLSHHSALFLIVREQKAIKVVLILPSIMISRKRDRLIDVKHSSLADLRRLVVLS